MADKKLTMSQLAALAKSAAAKVSPEADKHLRAFAQVGVGTVKRQIQGMHAVDTSTLLNSTVAESAGKDTILIGPTVDYAAYVALGTSRMPARPVHLAAAAEMQGNAGAFGFSPEDLGL